MIASSRRRVRGRGCFGEATRRGTMARKEEFRQCEQSLPRYTFLARCGGPVRHSCNKLGLQAGAHLVLVALVGVTLHRATKVAPAGVYLLYHSNWHQRVRVCHMAGRGLDAPWSGALLAGFGPTAICRHYSISRVRRDVVDVICSGGAPVGVVQYCKWSNTRSCRFQPVHSARGPRDGSM